MEIKVLEVDLQHMEKMLNLNYHETPFFLHQIENNSLATCSAASHTLQGSGVLIQLLWSTSGET